jgi:hypothetical protein
VHHASRSIGPTIGKVAPVRSMIGLPCGTHLVRYDQLLGSVVVVRNRVGAYVRRSARIPRPTIGCTQLGRRGPISAEPHAGSLATHIKIDIGRTERSDYRPGRTDRLHECGNAHGQIRVYPIAA